MFSLFVSATLWWYFGRVLVMFWWWLDDVWMMIRWCLYDNLCDVWMTLGWSLGDVWTLIKKTIDYPNKIDPSCKETGYIECTIQSRYGTWIVRSTALALLCMGYTKWFVVTLCIMYTALHMYLYCYLCICLSLWIYLYVYLTIELFSYSCIQLFFIYLFIYSVYINVHLFRYV